MPKEDTDALNNLDALIGQFSNWVIWLQTAKDIINNGRPSDIATIADLTKQTADLTAQVATLQPVIPAVIP